MTLERLTETILPGAWRVADLSLAIMLRVRVRVRVRVKVRVRVRSLEG